MSKNLVIIPTYNERENIVRMVDTVFALPRDFDLLIVDDGSPDGTGNLVRELQITYPKQLHLLERKGKLGLGTAYIAGFRWALEHHYEYIFEMDCDFSHNPQDLVRMLASLETESDLVVGSRYVKGGKLENWPTDRILLSYGASVYTRAITWMPIKDATAGFVGYKRAVLQAIDLDKIRFIGYAFQIEMKFAAYQLGFQLREIPITFTDRVEGTSKMSSGIIKEAIFGVIAMRWKGFFNSYKNESKIVDLPIAPSQAQRQHNPS